MLTSVYCSCTAAAAPLRTSCHCSVCSDWNRFPLSRRRPRATPGTQIRFWLRWNPISHIWIQRLRRIESITNDLISRGTPSERIALLGFSQGACLTLEFVARHPRRYAAVIGLTGGLIGPPGTPRNYPGSLAGTPVFLGTSDPDPHVPFQRVKETETVLSKIGAAVELRRYPGMPHTINNDEADAVRTLLQRAVAG